MARRTKADAEKTRAQIMASALKLFVKNGYEHTTFTDIAARLKLTKGAVYWHFKSKEALLVALVEQMHEQFATHISSQIDGGHLSFLTLAELMVEIAERVTKEGKSREFFLFLRTQVKWGEESMRSVREELISSQRRGPFKAFVQAVSNDRAAGYVRADVKSEEIAAICMSIWDGIIQARIDGFLPCELAPAIRSGFAAVWRSIASDKKVKEDE